MLRSRRSGLTVVLAVAALAVVGRAQDGPRSSRAPAAQTARPSDPLADIDLPDAWEERFWADPGVKALVALDASAIANLVPVQAGLRSCRCPACPASEADDPLIWSLTKPDIITCRQCGATFPNDKVPAKTDGKIPEEVVEVRPKILHKYPYHLVPPDSQAYPDERLYLAAKRDDRIREFLSKAALYSAVRAHERPQDPESPALARLAAVILLRFAQVYPNYATHYDQPGEPKFFDKADLAPPYRRGYRTAKWDWSASVGVPLNLVIAYAAIRGSPAFTDAGAALNDSQPARTIENGFFRASASFVRTQPEEFSEASLQVYRGLLAVGRLLGDPELVHDAVARLDEFAERGFYPDGIWRDGDAAAQRRVVAIVDGWIDRLLAGYSDSPGYFPPSGRRFQALPGAGIVPMLTLARSAERATLTDPRTAEIQQTAWPAPRASVGSLTRGPTLLGGAGLARLAVGKGKTAIDLEVRGLGDYGRHERSSRMSFRLAVGGRAVLGDLDDVAPLADGWDRATACHNTVAVDGLNQREDPEQARTAAPGADILFFAANRDLQAICLSDRHAYPRSASQYRQTVVAVASGETTYAVSVFDVEGGLQHDQFFHAAAGLPARWDLSAPMARRSASLLPPSMVFVPNAKAENGRWFVQAYGEFRHLSQGRIDRPAQAILSTPQGSSVRLHVLGDVPAAVVTALSPDPSAPVPATPADEPGRADLIVRRRSDAGSTLKSRFITVFEPYERGAPPIRVGRVAADPDVIVILVKTPTGDESLVLNMEPGAVREIRLADDRVLKTDGFLVRVVGNQVQLAGGTSAELGGRVVRHHRAAGTIVRASREDAGGSHGWFETAAPLPSPEQFTGRTLLIRHGNATSRGWTITRAVNISATAARIFVREEPGFRIDPESGDAQFYQFPRGTSPGPHTFVINQITQ